MNRQWMCNDCWHWFTLRCSAPLRLPDCERWLLSISHAFCYADKEVHEERICSRRAKTRRETDGGVWKTTSIKYLWAVRRCYDTGWFIGPRERLQRQIPASLIKLPGSKCIQLISISCSAKNRMLIQSEHFFLMSKVFQRSATCQTNVIII